jgi:hypothetical protein
LAKSCYEISPVQLHHKIKKKTHTSPERKQGKKETQDDNADVHA